MPYFNVSTFINLKSERQSNRNRFEFLSDITNQQPCSEFKSNVTQAGLRQFLLYWKKNRAEDSLCGCFRRTFECIWCPNFPLWDIEETPNFQVYVTVTWLRSVCVIIRWFYYAPNAEPMNRNSLVTERDGCCATVSAKTPFAILCELCNLME